MRQGYLLGADDCLVTPMDRERFLLIIHSKLKRYTELREQIEKQQRKLDEAKRAFTSMVAHELRTPLSSISMAADILGRQLNGQGLPEIREMLDIVQGGSVRMGRVVEQMVLYVMLESGALEGRRRIHLPQLGARRRHRAIDRARQFHYRGWKNLVHFNELDPGVLVRCDLATLKQALAEVISNAMTFADPDQPIQVTQWVSDGRSG